MFFDYSIIKKTVSLINFGQSRVVEMVMHPLKVKHTYFQMSIYIGTPLNYPTYSVNNNFLRANKIL